MGVKDLWSILSPTCEKKSLWELEGLNVAIDLSSWIVESQSVGHTILSNMYLRNLFFRTTYLLLLGVKPIFILEGKAPELKHDTIARRQEIAKGKQAKTVSNNKTGSRGRLNCLQKRCEELLLSMGVRCYRSEGEAEGFCSRLNELGIVDAVISQDSDCFLYGAKVVLRNFTMGPHYTCDKYTMDNIEKKLGLGRQKLLALSLLCGCDYEAGVQGVGKHTALTFLATLPDDQVLDRLRSWSNDDWCKSKPDISHMSWEEKLEYNIRKKAILNPRFPSEDVISEFLSVKFSDVPEFVWNKPILNKFMVIAVRDLDWDDDYIRNKFMPLMTRWHLLNKGGVSGLVLKDIVKKRSVRSVPSYELIWQDDALGHITTVEPIYLVAEVYAEMHQAFVDTKKPKKTGKKGTKKKPQNNVLENVEDMFEKLEISGTSTKQPIKKRGTQKSTKGLQTLDKFLLKKECISTSETVVLHSTPIKKPEQAQSFHYLSEDSVSSPFHKVPKPSLQLEENPCEKTLNLHSFADLSVDSETFNLSEIVNSIVTRVDNPALKIWTKQKCDY